jgi:tetratricopeptide (TPR) repeat protein
MGGVGKTQLAVEYIYRHMADYRVIWWIRSEELTTMAADYACLAVDLNLPEKDSTDQTEIAKAVKRWLEHNQGWLLIFDNAQNPGEIRNYLPLGGAGHVIITSRNPLWGGVAKRLPARVFDRAESIEFFCKRTGQEDKKAADALADVLGDLPLALEQAGAYIETTGIKLTEYQELFQSRRKELWVDESHPPDYPDSVATTWSLSMRQISHESQEAADLLNLCAFLAPDDISLELLCGGVEHLPELLAATATDKLAMNRAIKALRQYSLIATSGEFLSVHRLVQAVVRDRLGEDDEKRWTETVVRLLSAAFPFDSDDVRTWHQSSRLLPHALAAATHAESREVAPEVTQDILNQTGLYLHGRAEFAEAKVLFERALSLAEEAYGPNYPEVATIVNNLGSVLQDLGDLQGAKELFERALKIDEEAYGPVHPEVATIVNNLGLVLQALGDLQGAKELFEQALKIDEKTYGPVHPNVATRVNNLGSVLQDLGDLQGAKELFERALKIDEKAYGPDHPDVATDINNLGSVLQDLGELQGAKEHFERALKIDEEAYGPVHPNVARDVNNLGLVLRALGDLQGAKEHFERALKIDEEAYSPDHPNVARDVNNLASVLQDLGDPQGAKELFERALKIDEKTYGPDHPEVARDVSNLGSVLRALNDRKGAKELFDERALKIDEKTYGPVHPEVAIHVNNLGRILQDLGDLQGAKEHYERALKIDEKTYGPDHPHVARDVNNLGRILQDLGDLQGAKEHYERALAIFQKSLGENHPSTATVRNNLELLANV